MSLFFCENREDGTKRLCVQPAHCTVKHAVKDRKQRSTETKRDNRPGPSDTKFYSSRPVTPSVVSTQQQAFFLHFFEHLVDLLACLLHFLAPLPVHVIVPSAVQHASLFFAHFLEHLAFFE